MFKFTSNSLLLKTSCIVVILLLAEILEHSTGFIVLHQGIRQRGRKTKAKTTKRVKLKNTQLTDTVAPKMKKDKFRSGDFRIPILLIKKR